MDNEPTREQVVRCVEDSERLAGEVVMLDLLEFKVRAESVAGGSGGDSYRRYGEVDDERVQGDREGGFERTVLLAMAPGDVFAAVDNGGIR